MHLHCLINSGVAEHLNNLAQSSLASTRLRSFLALKAAEALNWQVTFGEKIQGYPDVVIVGKIGANQIDIRCPQWIKQISCVKKHARIFLDYTDHHLGTPSSMTAFYKAAINMSDACIVPSEGMAKMLMQFWSGPISLIEDPVEIECSPPKDSYKNPVTLLWFGHSSNIEFLIKFLRDGFCKGDHIRLIVLSNESGLYYFANSQIVSAAKIEFNLALWSLENMKEAAKVSDGCIIPSDLNDSKKIGASSNRLITALALGLPTAADQLPSYQEFSRYYCDIRSQDFRNFLNHPYKDRDLVIQAQTDVIPRFSMPKIENDWKDLLLNAIS